METQRNEFSNITRYSEESGVEPLGDGRAKLQVEERVWLAKATILHGRIEVL